MLKQEPIFRRTLPVVQYSADLVVVGGGLSGICSAIAAARAGCKVLLVQDRPILGGNASSEVRLWVLGATSHMGNNNRWSREGGILDEILVENTYRNPEGNPLMVDVLLLEKVVNETNITLLLNTAVYDLDKNENGTIHSVKAVCSQNQTEYLLTAPIFVDASGDGILGFLSGAAFRMGAESKEEFGEEFAPDRSYGELLGHSLYFYSKDTGKPVKFTAPSFALKDISAIPRYRNFNASDYGCRLWWIEFGGRLDTIFQSEEIKWELWKVVYGVWDYIKNSGKFPEAETLTLEWVGMIPGKRESRRFEGEYILKQQDIIQQTEFEDAIAYGGWSIDLHPADGVYSEKPGCNQWHSKGVYQIPFRCLYSRNINNLFLAGRIISATHVAFASTRVMGTGACIGQAVGQAAAMCIERNIYPKDILAEKLISTLQQSLLKNGHFIPGVNAKIDFQNNLIASAAISASSEFKLSHLSKSGKLQLIEDTAQMFPVSKGAVPTITVAVQADGPTLLSVELRTASSLKNFTPEVILEQQNIQLAAGGKELTLEWKTTISEDQYLYLVFRKNELVQLSTSKQRITGILTLYNTVNKAVSNFGKQEPPAGIGVDAFEFWVPKRRPAGENIALRFAPGIEGFKMENIRNGVARPTRGCNAWVASLEDAQPEIAFHWREIRKIKRVELSFDTDFDHPMETVLMSHPERVMPFCVQSYCLIDDQDKIVFEKVDNHQTRNVIEFPTSISTKSLSIRLKHPSHDTPAALFEVRCYEE